MSERRSAYAVRAIHAMQTAQAVEVTGVVDGKTVDRPPRCSTCGRALGEYAARPWALKCRRCGACERRH